jgi:hypothetical protein
LFGEEIRLLAAQTPLESLFLIQLFLSNFDFTFTGKLKTQKLKDLIVRAKTPFVRNAASGSKPVLFMVCCRLTNFYPTKTPASF